MTAQERLLIEQGDTFAVIPYMRAKILMGEIADLSLGIRQRDSLILAKDREIERCKNSKDELKHALSLSEAIVVEKNKQMDNLGEIQKNKRKMWRNRFIYGSAGGLAVGLLTGLIIAR